MRKSFATNRQALFSVTGVIEAATGLALLAVPSWIIELLLGAALGTPAGLTAARAAGAAMLALGAACWFARKDGAGEAATGLIAAMLIYNVAVDTVLLVAWTSDGLMGPFFWPAVIVHAAMAIWCVACLSGRTSD